MRDIRNLTSGPIDLLKLDIEGAEYSCLEALAPDPRQIRCLAVEFHDYERGTERINDALKKLLANGYRLLDAHRQEIELPYVPKHDAELVWAVRT